VGFANVCWCVCLRREGEREGKAEGREKEKLAAHGHKMARACAGVNVAKNVSEPGRFRFLAD